MSNHFLTPNRIRILRRAFVIEFWSNIFTVRLYYVYCKKDVKVFIVKTARCFTFGDQNRGRLRWPDIALSVLSSEYTISYENRLNRPMTTYQD